MDLNKELMSNLLELDDVDAVYTDQNWSNKLSFLPQQLIRSFGPSCVIETVSTMFFSTQIGLSLLIVS